jgi:uncharacterized protein YjiS (DUF1127 family)
MKSVFQFNWDQKRTGCAEPVLNQKRRKSGLVPLETASERAARLGGSFDDAFRAHFRLFHAKQASAARPGKSSFRPRRPIPRRGSFRRNTIMYAHRHDDDCTSCTGPVRQVCKVRPSIRPLTFPLPTSGAQASALLGDPLRFKVNGPFDGETGSPKRPGWISRLQDGLAALRHKAAQRRRNRQIARELSVLDDRTLRDIGLSRPEIDAAIARTRRGGR